MIVTLHCGLEQQHLWIKGLSTNYVHNFPGIHFKCIPVFRVTAFPFDPPMQSGTCEYIVAVFYLIFIYYLVYQFGTVGCTQEARPVLRPLIVCRKPLLHKTCYPAEP